MLRGAGGGGEFWVGYGLFSPYMGCHSIGVCGVDEGLGNVVEFSGRDVVIGIGLRCVDVAVCFGYLLCFVCLL